MSIRWKSTIPSKRRSFCRRKNDRFFITYNGLTLEKYNNDTWKCTCVSCFVWKIFLHTEVTISTFKVIITCKRGMKTRKGSFHTHTKHSLDLEFIYYYYYRTVILNVSFGLSFSIVCTRGPKFFFVPLTVKTCKVKKW